MTRHHAARFFSFVFLFFMFASTGVFAEELSGRHLFFDPAFLETVEAATLTVNPPLSKEIALRRDKPWERFIVFYLTVLDENGKLRLWYNGADPENRRYLAYAESTDGVHWVKPELGRIEYKGSKANNLVGFMSHEGTVFRDPKAPDAERYAYVANIHKGGGVYRFFSPDGLSWKRDAEPLIRFDCDSQNVVLWDEPLGKYVLFLRGWDYTKPRPQGRKVVRMEADRLDRPIDLKAKEYERRHPGELDREPFLRDELPTAFARDESDPVVTDVYTNSMQLYPVDPRWYLGFPAMYRHAVPRSHPVTKVSDGRTEIRFIAGPDGKIWNDFGCNTYLAPGPAGSEDSNSVYMGVGLVVRGDELWQYGTGYTTTHGDTKTRAETGDGVIYRYRHRIDGFVSLDFGNETGRCVTKPVVVQGDRLLLNLDAGATGRLRIGLRDENGKPIPGFGVEDCLPLQINGVSASAAWKDQADLKTLRGKQVRFEIEGFRVKLYSLRFAPLP